MSWEIRANCITNGIKALEHDKTFARNLRATGFETLASTMDRVVNFANNELVTASKDTPQTELQKRHNLSESSRKLDGEVRLLQSPDLASVSLSPEIQKNTAAMRKEVLERTQAIQQMLTSIQMGTYTYNGPVGDAARSVPKAEMLKRPGSLTPSSRF